MSTRPLTLLTLEAQAAQPVLKLEIIGVLTLKSFFRIYCCWRVLIFRMSKKLLLCILFGVVIILCSAEKLNVEPIDEADVVDFDVPEGTPTVAPPVAGPTSMPGFHSSSRRGFTLRR